MLKEAIRTYFFNPGFSWTRRAARFIPYVVPAGCIPSASRYIAFPAPEKEYLLLGVAASNVASAFLRFYGEWFQRPNYMVETAKLLPWPEVDQELGTQLKEKILVEVKSRRRAYQNHEPFHEFTVPLLIWADGTTEKALNFRYESLLGDEL
jgi:hypothetical protein